MELYFENTTGTEIPLELTDKLEAVIKLGLTRAGRSDENLEVGVTFVTPEEIRRLNGEYRARDAVTDVLSFAYEADSVNINGAAPIILGDIVVCVARAKEQAEEYGHSFEREMAFLTAHGLMHLLGYDHENGADEQKMTDEQNAVLNALGISR